MSSRIRLALIASLVFPLVACDQAAKVIAARALEAGPVQFLGGIVQFRLVMNTGAFLSLGENLPDSLRIALFFGVVPIGLIAAAVMISTTQATRATIVGVSLILGGGLGNLLDRAMHGGGVVDFVSIGFGGLRTGIFNVADVAIMAGVGIVLWELRHGPPPVTPPDSPPQSPSR